MTPTIKNASQLIKSMEEFLAKYIKFQDAYGLPIALWTMGTYLFEHFDAFPYMIITSATKRSGKSRLSELIGFVCSKPEPFSAMTPATLFNVIEEQLPTIFFDEAEILSSESANNMRAVLNIGYRKGQTVPRMVAEYWDEKTQEYSKVKRFRVYCPKVFILIGDVYDTLKDRSIIVRMKRAEPGQITERFVYDNAQEEGKMIGAQFKFWAEKNLNQVQDAFRNHSGLGFLTDRDEEIWTPIFMLCSMLCPERMHELERIAVDMSMEKTAEAEKYMNLLGSGAEQKASQDEMAVQLLNDLHSLFTGKIVAITSLEAIEKLQAINTAPWRKFRGEGLTVHSMADMLQCFGLSPQKFRTAGGRENSTTKRGYRLQDVKKAIEKYKH